MGHTERRKGSGGRHDGDATAGEGGLVCHQAQVFRLPQGMGVMAREADATGEDRGWRARASWPPPGTGVTARRLVQLGRVGSAGVEAFGRTSGKGSKQIRKKEGEIGEEKKRKKRRAF